ncbi:transcriptional regulator, TetR family [Coriobacterium glomerans PW2]|uniref:Transcriptional regulator, TetR family n=1 Tax=Coriobacterium glomerans (strain ATCC 49209 / DSM 20642 / JCM 10262 / PW2) TaxID=700015 RepID=F2N929_CORGP|nr:TetR family transcriptional regulator [Coriobacterium glomerans]AEB07705.1 transcriptional regulator, TetR family [Coriobacterium glomerans PW2]
MTAQRKSAIRPAGHRSEAAQRRLNEIISAAVDIINARGFNGMSLQGVADRVGITQAGVLHYVGDKQGLLVEVIRHYYNCSSSMQDYLSLFVPNGSLAGQLPKIPEFCRLIVAENAHQPELVLLFQILNTEAISRDSPTHEYFAQRSKEVSDPSHGRDWSVPEGVDAKLALSVAMAAMYGLEGRWLARPDEIDYEAEWARFEDFLFPLPQWEGYR